MRDPASGIWTVALMVRLETAPVDLSGWSDASDDEAVESYPYRERAFDSKPPHGITCPCLMCADMRASLGARPLEEILGDAF